MDKPNRPQRKNERMKEILNSGIFFFVSDEFIKLCTILESAQRTKRDGPRLHERGVSALGSLSRKQTYG